MDLFRGVHLVLSTPIIRWHRTVTQLGFIESIKSILYPLKLLNLLVKVRGIIVLGVQPVLKLV